MHFQKATKSFMYIYIVCCWTYDIGYLNAYNFVGYLSKWFIFGSDGCYYISPISAFIVYPIKQKHRNVCPNAVMENNNFNKQ